MNTEITLNRFSFFDRLYYELPPNPKLEISLLIESDGNLIWQNADNCRVVVITNCHDMSEYPDTRICVRTLREAIVLNRELVILK